MKPYIKYNTTTGAIIQYGSAGDDMHAATMAFLRLVEPVGEVIEAEMPTDVECYVDVATQTVTPCMDMPIILDEVTLVFTGVPVGTAVRVDGNEIGVCDDGIVDFDHEVPGEHQIVFTHPRYKRTVFEVTT